MIVDNKNQGESKLYLYGIISLVTCLGFLFFSLYIVPFLIWNLNYKVPQLILTIIAWLEDNYNFTEGQSRFCVWLIFFIPAIILGIVSNIISHRIDKQVLKVDSETEEEEEAIHEMTEAEEQHAIQVREELKESASFGFKLLFLMIVIVAGFLLLQIVIQATA